MIGPDPDALAAARFVMCDYHGGQYSAGYAYVSTGTITPGLAAEARQAAALARDAGAWEDADALDALAIAADVAADLIGGALPEGVTWEAWT